MMTISARTLAILAAAGSAFLLLAALFYQWLGYVPCELCILQRWPHLAAVVIGALIAFRDVHLLRWLGALATALACAFAAFHAGVEFGWWQGPTACTGGLGDISAMSTQDLMARLQSAPVVRCDQPQWYFLGLTMAAWNAIFSAILTVAWVRSALGRGIGR